MQEKQLFEYAVIRVVPCVEREEFINAGVVLYCASQHFLKAIVTLNHDRVKALCADTDVAAIEKRLNAFRDIAAGLQHGGPIAAFPIASRFRWLTAVRSTIVQTSAVHPGLCINAEETLQKLYIQLVK